MAAKFAVSLAVAALLPAQAVLAQADRDRTGAMPTPRAQERAPAQPPQAPAAGQHSMDPTVDRDHTSAMPTERPPATTSERERAPEAPAAGGTADPSIDRDRTGAMPTPRAR